MQSEILPVSCLTYVIFTIKYINKEGYVKFISINSQPNDDNPNIFHYNLSDQCI